MMTPEEQREYEEDIARGQVPWYPQPKQEEQHD